MLCYDFRVGFKWLGLLGLFIILLGLVGLIVLVGLVGLVTLSHHARTPTPLCCASSSRGASPPTCACWTNGNGPKMNRKGTRNGTLNGTETNPKRTRNEPSPEQPSQSDLVLEPSAHGNTFFNQGICWGATRPLR